MRDTLTKVKVNTLAYVITIDAVTCVITNRTE